MAPEKFTEKVGEKLNEDSVFFPIIGTIGNLQIAVNLLHVTRSLRRHEFIPKNYRADLLFANNLPSDDRAYRLRGKLGSVADRGYSIASGRKWSNEFSILEGDLRPVADQVTYARLTRIAPPPGQTPQGIEIKLYYFDPGSALGETPTINGVELENAVAYLPVGLVPLSRL